MNLALLDSELFELPEIIEDRLSVAEEVVVCAFNRRGNLLAGGCAKGAVVIWDFDTHGLARHLVAHSGRITGVHWTRSSRKLISSSVDGNMVVWDVLNSAAVQTLNLGGEVLQSALHPRRRTLCLACVNSVETAGEACLVSLQPGSESHVALLPNGEAPSQVRARCSGSAAP